MWCAMFMVVIAVALYFAPLLWQKGYVVHTTGGVLVTGASSGIGRHAALTIAAKTKYTVFAGVRKQKDAESLRAEAEKSGFKVFPVILDVTNQAQVDAVKAEVMAHLGNEPFVALLNNAGVSTGMPLELLDIDTAKWVFDVNYFGAMRVTKAFIPEIRKHKGRVLFTNSILGHIVAPAFGVYSESKYALRAYAMQLRMELSHFDVSVSTLSPGVINTELDASTTKRTASEMEQVDPAVMQLYPQYFSCGEEKREPILAAAENAESMNDGLMDALISQTPQVEYFSSNFAGVPVGILARLQWFLPTRLHEIITESDKTGHMTKFADAKCMADFRATAPKSR